MIEKIQHATASSPEGAKGLVKGVLACAFQNMAFMLPTGLLYLLVKDLLAGSTSGRTAFYLLGCAACFALILLTTWFQYNGTYFTTYKESGTRRLTLAERLRKLPLSFFGKRDLADLTSTIMADCEVLEKDCSHFIPGLFGSLISTVLIALSLFAFDGRMALAALWVIPVSAAIVVGSYRVQDKVQARTMAAKMACADGIQEYIETLRDLKASNAEQRYLSGLSDKIRAVEKQSIAAELETALFVSSASMVLKLGIASVALTGAVLLVQGSIDVLTLFLFLMAASRMYDPMQGALQNLAAVIAMRTNVGRMNEILDAPLQTGSEQLTNQGCDIVFDHVGFAYNSGETVLRDVSFTAKQGEVTALVGPSGGGKTTVSRLAARFWDYQKGSITVGGMDISKIDPEKLMSLYSIVFQDVTLFDNTILENIRLGRKGATDEEVLAAAKLANCEEFAEKLPDTEYQNCVDALFAAWDRLEKWSASLPMTAEKKAESERFQVLSRQKKTILTCCNYVTEVEFEVAEAGQPTRWLCYSDADFAGFVVTDRSSIADDSKPQEYYEQVQVLESYEELEIARGSAYYALFAQMQKMAEEN